METNNNHTTPSIPVVAATQTVFIVLRKSDLLILGCFSDRQKAEKYINLDLLFGDLAIKELTVH